MTCPPSCGPQAGVIFVEFFSKKGWPETNVPLHRAQHDLVIYCPAMVCPTIWIWGYDNGIIIADIASYHGPS